MLRFSHTSFALSTGYRYFSRPFLKNIPDPSDWDERFINAIKASYSSFWSLHCYTASLSYNITTYCFLLIHHNVLVLFPLCVVDIKKWKSKIRILLFHSTLLASSHMSSSSISALYYFHLLFVRRLLFLRITCPY